MRGQPKISSVYRLGQPSVDTDPMATWGRVERLRRLAWVDHGTIVIRPDDLPEGLRLEMIRWANENLGARHGR